jgi:protein TonB
LKPELAASFIAAIIFHALLLFGFTMGTPAHPLAMSDEPSPVDVSLVEAAPEPAAQADASVAPTPIQPASTPPPPEPTPAPTPPEPESTPEMSTPPPEATPQQEDLPSPESTPVPQHPKAAPHHPPQNHSRASKVHSFPGAATAAGLVGATGHGTSNGSLSSHARYLSNPRPDYPEVARQQHQEGMVLVSVEVGTDGHASDVILARTSGFPLLDAAALQAVRRWRFEPAQVGGLPVSSRVDVPVRFSLAR